MQRSQNYFTPFMGVPRRRKSSFEKLVELLIESNALHSKAMSFVLAAPVFFALGFAIAMRTVGHG
jgi:hypothetical protein